jgi:hypothetical protein
MDEIRERDRPWDERTGLVELGVVPMMTALNAIRRTLPTARHARRFAEAVERRLGDRSFVDPSATSGNRWVHVRDAGNPSFVRATPLVRFTLGRTSFSGPLIRVAGGVEPVGAPARPTGEPPARLEPEGDDLCACELRIAEDLAHLELAYDDRGQLKETSSSAADPWISLRYPYVRPYTIDPAARPPTPRPLSLLCRADLSGDGHTIDELADMLVESLRADPMGARVHMPKAIPGGIWTALMTAIGGARRALFEGAATQVIGGPSSTASTEARSRRARRSTRRSSAGGPSSSGRSRVRRCPSKACQRSRRRMSRRQSRATTRAA